MDKSKSAILLLGTYNDMILQCKDFEEYCELMIGVFAFLHLAESNIKESVSEEDIEQMKKAAKQYAEKIVAIQNEKERTMVN